MVLEKASEERRRGRADTDAQGWDIKAGLAEVIWSFHRGTHTHTETHSCSIMMARPISSAVGEVSLSLSLKGLSSQRRKNASLLQRGARERETEWGGGGCKEKMVQKWNSPCDITEQEEAASCLGSNSQAASWNAKCHREVSLSRNSVQVNSALYACLDKKNKSTKQIHKSSQFYYIDQVRMGVVHYFIDYYL